MFNYCEQGSLTALTLMAKGRAMEEKEEEEEEEED